MGQEQLFPVSMDGEHHIARGAEIVEALMDALRRFEAGEVNQPRCAFSIGTYLRNIVLGFASEQERDEALAKLRRMLDQPH